VIVGALALAGMSLASSDVNAQQNPAAPQAGAPASDAPKAAGDGGVVLGTGEAGAPAGGGDGGAAGTRIVMRAAARQRKL